MKVEEGLNWGGVASGVRWRFLNFRTEMGAQVFVVECGMYWTFGGEMGGGLRWWLLRECCGGVGEGDDGCVVRILKCK